MRFAFTSQPIEKQKDGKETIDLFVRTAGQFGSTAPELALSWERDGKTDWKMKTLAITCEVEQHLTASRLFRNFSRLLEQTEIETDDADALIMEMERGGSKQIVFDPRVRKNVPVDSLTDEKGSQYAAKIGDEILATTMAEDEDVARAQLVRAVQVLMDKDEDKIDLCARWFKEKKKVFKMPVQGNAPIVHPVEGYLKRGSSGHRKLEAKKAKDKGESA
jgi:hypothetical protein